MVDGYAFVKSHYDLAKNRQHYKCRRRGCKIKAYRELDDEAGKILIKKDQMHQDHEKDTHIVRAISAKRQMSLRARIEIDKTYREIYKDLKSDIPIDILSWPLCREAMKKSRAKGVPKIPADFRDLRQMLDSKDPVIDSFIYINDELFYRACVEVDGEFSFIFINHDLWTQIESSIDEVFIDATFSGCAKGFYQCMIIGALKWDMVK